MPISCTFLILKTPLFLARQTVFSVMKQCISYHKNSSISMAWQDEQGEIVPEVEGGFFW